MSKQTQTAKPNFEKIIAKMQDENNGLGADVAFFKMKKAEQVELLGAYLGKGYIMIDWTGGRIEHQVSACFGADSVTTKAINIFDENPIVEC